MMDALTLTFTKHKDTYINAARRVVQDRALAEDVVQDSYIQASRKLNTFSGAVPALRGWLYTIVVNTAKNSIKYTKPSVEHTKVTLACTTDIEQEYIEQQQSIQLSTSLGTLPDRQRATVLYRLDGLPFDTIASRMDCACSTAKANYRHALKSLRRLTS